MLAMDQSERAAIRAVVDGLEASWNKGDASGFAKYFAIAIALAHGERGGGRSPEPKRNRLH
jgi:hypothetical protein